VKSHEKKFFFHKRVDALFVAPVTPPRA
jgi:hypothetical protein